ncbi:MAG: hypothetical protein AB7V14_07820 [Kiritimatiellia bacterium]
MTARSTLLLAALLAACWDAPSRASIYEVPEMPGEVVGAWDANILADDVHFETAAIVGTIRQRLAIKGNQTCTLWVFDALNRPPIHTVSFTNVPAADPFDVSTYDFPMHLQVPRDVYVGFSAQGDGWTNTFSDYWSWGTNVVRGIVGTAGQYYYGTVAGGQLATSYNAGNDSYGCMQILAAPARIDGMAVATGHVHLAISELPIYATNAVERVESAGETNWAEAETLPLGASNHVWVATNGPATSAFYRVRSR